MSFELFWDSYPKRVGKKKAQRAWEKTGAELRLGEVLASIADWKKTAQWQDINYIPYPATFLNEERWKDPVPREMLNGTRPANGTRGPIESFDERRRREAQAALSEIGARARAVVQKVERQLPLSRHNQGSNGNVR